MQTTFEVAIVDHETESRQQIRSLLSPFDNCFFNISWEADTLLLSQKQLAIQPPDLLILSTDLPDGLGFDLLIAHDDPTFQTIFITSEDSFALRAFQCSAVDYLIKPIDPVLFRKALKKVTQQNTLQHHFEKVEQLLSFHARKKAERIILSSEEGLEILLLPDIIRLEGDGSYTTIYMTSGEKKVASKSLGVFEEQLLSGDFFRLHHSHIVNLNHVKKYLKEDGGMVVLSNGHKVEVARRRKEQFLARLCGM